MNFVVLDVLSTGELIRSDDDVVDDPFSNMQYIATHCSPTWS